MNTKWLHLALLLSLQSFVFSQINAQVAINSTASLPDGTAMLDVSSTTRGFLAPRMTSTQRNAISSPAEGLLVYQTDITKGFYYYSGSAWTYLTSNTATNWSLFGNTGTPSGSYFVGTTDNTSLRFRTNNTQRLWFDSVGSVGIGTSPTFTTGTHREKFLVDAGTTTSYNVISGKGTINNYLQLNIQNRSNGTAASSDVVATADNGDESSGFVDFGINGSGNTSTGVLGGAGTGYLYSTGNDFAIGNATAAKNLAFFTNGTAAANERMRINAAGDVGIGVTDPGNNLVVKDTMEIRRTGSNISQLLFSNTSGTGDFKIAGDGGDIYWQGGGGRSLQMGSYWPTILGGDRQTTVLPSFVNGTAGTGVLVLAQRDASVPLAVQANSATQSANLMEWRNSAGTVLNIVDASGNVGIGTTTTSTKLHVNGTNPLTLGGLQSGTSGDSVLSVSNGIVKRLSPSAFSTSASNSWLKTGNTGTPSGSYFLGTTDNTSLRFRTNNTQRMVIDSLGRVGIGGTGFNATYPEKLLVDAGTTTSRTLANFTGSINNYLQLNVQNTSSGNNASSDIVATANNGTEVTGYVDLGINGGGYTSGNSNLLNGANTAYLYASADDFYIGNGATDKSLLFFTNTGVQGDDYANGVARMTIIATGQVGIGMTPSTTHKLYVNGSVQASSYATSSDKRLKTNIANLDYGLKHIMALQPVSYHWKDTAAGTTKQLGLIAQDVKKIIPEMVIGDEAKESLAVNYTELIPVLINAVKEQQKQIEAQQKQIEELKRLVQLKK